MRERERESERIVGKYSISSQSDDHCFSCTFPSFFFFSYNLSFWVILRDREQLVLLLSRCIQIRKIVIIVFFYNKNLLKCQFLNVFFFCFFSLKIPFCFVDFNLYSFFCSRVSLLELAFILFLFSFVCAMMTVFASGSLLKSRLPMRRQLRDYYIGSHPYYACDPLCPTNALFFLFHCYGALLPPSHLPYIFKSIDKFLSPFDSM